MKYYPLYYSRGLSLQEPDLPIVEEEIPVVNGSFTLKGAFEDTYLLDLYPAIVKVSHGQRWNLIAKTYFLPVSEKGQFEETFPLEFGPGEYEITISVPQEQHSYDDLTVIRVVGFYLINE